MNLFIQGHYIITYSLMYMISRYDRYGNPFTQIVETGRTIFINKSPIEVLAYSLRCIGCTLDGAIESSKWMLKMEKMVPIVANPFQEVVLFPTRSLTHEDSIWFNPYHIRRTSNIKGKTLIILSNLSSLYIPTRISSFNTKIQSVEQLKKMTTEVANGTFTMVLESEKRKEVKKTNTKQKD
ncbi:hypothetical protein EKG37_06915 [Robertmurraya yapensis]|uniref:Competence protein ComK n=1 Tax=Bacillus yapensis TaxID=2492960 RepID=A0A3S0IH92_9BACI|nr:competence protein ComK [Bacillus yapensis]RTR33938.1 hypothetical protein EKG37_06915 [Bacillus yapensis]TKS97256.1 hypothetical protein FAR12_06915 [Bacillus yapensis]